MGLAASQGRYLCLTARMSDLVYEGQQISQQRLNIATETQAIADRYAEATSNKIMVANVYSGGSEASSQVQLTYDLLTRPTAEYGLGYRLVDKYGSVVVPGENLTEEDGNTTTEDGTEVKSTKSYPSHIVGENDTVCIDENVKDPEYLQMMITSGEYYIQSIPNPETGKWEELTWQGSNNITEVYDTSDDAAAEAQYEADMRALQKKDKILELRLEQVETEEGSVEKEIESIKGVIDKNIENSFKTFA